MNSKQPEQIRKLRSKANKSIRYKLNSINKKLDDLNSKVAAPKPQQGFWDRLAPLSTFLSSVILGAVGLYFTHSYNDTQAKNQKAMQDAQLKVAQTKAASEQRIAELQALITLTPLLASKDSAVKKTAKAIITALHDSTLMKDEVSGPSLLYSFAAEILNNDKTDPNLLNQYAKLAKEDDLPDSLKAKAAKKVGNIALTPGEVNTKKTEAFSIVAELAKSSPNNTVKQVAQQTLNTLDARSEAIINKLQPPVKLLARKLIDSAGKLGIPIKIISGLRTYDEQDALYARGRTTPGPIVVNAKAGYSNHNFGLAFDIGIFSSGVYNNSSQAYKTVGAIGKSLGLIWGGDYPTIKDEPHFEFHPAWAAGMTETNFLAELRRRKEAGQSFF